MPTWIPAAVAESAKRSAPVADCVTMITEAEFNDNDSQYEMWQKDKEGYTQWYDLID